MGKLTRSNVAPPPANAHILGLPQLNRVLQSFHDYVSHRKVSASTCTSDHIVREHKHARAKIVLPAFNMEKKRRKKMKRIREFKILENAITTYSL